MQRRVQLFIMRMQEAAGIDVEALKEGKPAIHKLQMLKVRRLSFAALTPLPRA